jgi:pimeloyl-ACP methyl ester carboxylesterase
MPFFQTPDGAQLHYQWLGRLLDQRRPPLVFAHGWCSNLEHWARQVAGFSETHRILLIDRRGHGRSSRPDGECSPERHAHDMAAIMGSLETRGAVVVGHAGGGPPVLELAGRYPELVRAAVFIDAGLYRGVSAEQAALSPAVTRLEGPDYQPVFIKQYETYFHPVTPLELKQRIAAEAAQTSQAVIVDELRWILRSNTIELASKVKQPVLWTVASESKATAAYVREHLPQARFAQVVGAGHYLHVEVPDQWNAMLRRFIELL